MYPLSAKGCGSPETEAEADEVELVLETRAGKCADTANADRRPLVRILPFAGC